MDTESIVYGGLFVGQLVGSLLLVLGLFWSGPGALMIAGGILIFASIAGLAFTTTLVDEDDHSIHAPEWGVGRFPRLGRGSKR